MLLDLLLLLLLAALVMLLAESVLETVRWRCCM
jgi:hypothetical protein